MTPRAGDLARRTLVFADLDDTLFQTERKMSPAAREGARLASVAANGSHSFMTAAQMQLVDLLSGGVIIPVTARGTDAFARVALPFSGAAVLANGAVIRNAEGRACPLWRARVDRALSPFRAVLDGITATVVAVADQIGVKVRTWLVEEEGLGGVYAVVKVEPGFAESALVDVSTRISAHLTAAGQRGWTVHVNGNNLAFIPPAFSKSLAVKHLIDGVGDRGAALAIGLGDSASDLEFMRLCDFWMTPTGSQIDVLHAVAAKRAADAASRREDEPVR